MKKIICLLTAVILFAGFSGSTQANAKSSRTSGHGSSQLSASTILKKRSWGWDFRSDMESKLKSMGYKLVNTQPTILYEVESDEEEGFIDIPVSGLIRTYVKNGTYVLVYVVTGRHSYIAECEVYCADKNILQRMKKSLRSLGLEEDPSGFSDRDYRLIIDIKGYKLTFYFRQT